MNYHIAREGQQLGIFSDTEVNAKLQTGELQSSDLCWAEGMANWQTLSSVLPGTAAPVAYAPAAAGYNPYAPPSVDVSRTGIPQYKLASLGQRLGAKALNFLVFFALLIPLSIGMALSSSHENTGFGIAVVAATGFGWLGLIGYNIYLLADRGQSLGKKWLGIKIVNYEDHGNAGFVKTVILRWLIGKVISFFVPLIYDIVDICFIFGEERRCIHDLIAGTTVIQVEQ